MRCTLVFIAVLGCSAPRARMVRDLGIGVTIEGALVTGAAYMTADPGDGVRDALRTAAPLLAAGALAWIAGEVAGALASR